MKVDILAVGVHPDDVELGCAGTIFKHIKAGKSVAVLDLTLGELGTRGNREIRKAEAAKASTLLGLACRKHLDFRDGFFENNESHQRKVIQILRELRPDIVLCNAISDRHPDHGRSARLVSEACFYSGLLKVETLLEGRQQQPWRPGAVYHYIQDHYIHPDFVVDVTEFHADKHKAIMTYTSQFYNAASSEPETPISSREFLQSLDSKMSIWGRAIGVKYAEGFTVERYPGVNLLSDLI